MSSMFCRDRKFGAKEQIGTHIVLSLFDEIHIREICLPCGLGVKEMKRRVICDACKLPIWEYPEECDFCYAEGAVMVLLHLHCSDSHNREVHGIAYPESRHRLSMSRLSS